MKEKYLIRHRVLKHLQEKNKKKSNGCFGIVLLLVVSGFSIVYGLTKTFL